MATNPPRLQYHFADLMKFVGVFSLVLALFAWQGMGLNPVGGWYENYVIPTGAALVVALSWVRPMRWSSLRCVGCGRACFPWTKAEPYATCPACRMARLPRSEQRRVGRRLLVVCVFLIVLLATTLVAPFSDAVAARTDISSFIVLPLVVLALAAVLFGLLVVAVVVGQLARTYRLSRPGRALEFARGCAGDEGEPVELGLTTVWGLGGKVPVALVQEPMAAAGERFWGLVGAPAQELSPLDVFVFAKRNAFTTFLGQGLFVTDDDHDGMFIPWPRLTVACTTDAPSWRLGDIERALRMLFAYHALASYKRFPVAAWLQVGIANAVACGGDPDELRRLNRKMLAALASGRVLDGAALFTPRPAALVALLRNHENRAKFWRYTQFVAQSWSVVEFLCGADAPEHNRARFAAFLQELQARQPLQAAFERHFELDYPALHVQWQCWVRARAVDGFDPAPQRVQDVLRGHVVPLVGNALAPLAMRVRAIREMGRAGYVPGADALIALVGSRHSPLAGEAVWALESISGAVLGKDPSPWVTWWEGLPAEVKEFAPEPYADPRALLVETTQ